MLFLVVLIVASLSKLRIEEVDDFDPFDKDRDKYEAASGWMIFVSIMGMITEAFIVVARFLNFSIVNRNFSLIGVLVSNRRKLRDANDSIFITGCCYEFCVYGVYVCWLGT